MKKWIGLTLMLCLNKKASVRGGENGFRVKLEARRRLKQGDPLSPYL